MSVRQRVAFVAAVVLGALCAGPAAAGAHPLLVTSAPAPGSLIPKAPSVLALAFSEPAVPTGSAITVTGLRSRSIALGHLKASDGGRQLSASLPSKLTAGVYRVHWVALGVDGHTVSGDFNWGISEPNGAPPPRAAVGLGAVGTGGRGGTAAGQGIVSAAVQWLGILAASMLWAGGLLVWALGRRGAEAAPRARQSTWTTARWALLAAAVASVYTVLQDAGAGAGGGLDPGLLVASGTGLSAIARLLLALAGGGAVLVAARRSADAGRSPERAGLVGLGLLIAYGASGHVIAQANALAALGMAVHVVAAGTWAGGVLVLLALAWRGALPAGEGARTFAPFAAGGLAVAALTGVIAAFREISHLYFLWWSPYGRLVIVKVAVVAAAAALGTLMAVRARRGAVSGRPLGLMLEGGLVVVVIALASTLSGLAQGRGQPLPAQTGDLLPGPALSNVLLSSGPAPITLAPAREGINTLAVTPPGHPHSVLVRLVCGCDVRPVIAELHGGANGVFSAQIPVPDKGTWNAYVTVDRAPAPAPVALPVGVASAPGAPVRQVLAVADLSGPGAARCSRYLIGDELAIGRLNGSGGVNGGDKVAIDALDDGGSPVRAAQLATAALARTGAARPVALMPCGAGAEPAIAAASRAGLPTIAGDPATGLVAGRRIYRVAADPYADGVALGQAISIEVKPNLVPGERTLKVIAVDDAQGRRRLEGLRATLASAVPSLRIELIPLRRVTGADSAQMSVLLDRRTTAALVVDGTDAQSPAIAAAIGRLPALHRVFDPAPVFVSERLLSETFIDQSGNAGRVGVVQGTSTAAVDSRDGLILSQALPALFPGESASLEALRGYVSGLALAYGVQSGTAAAPIAARLERPPAFTDAIAEPWLSTAPAAGAQRLTIVTPSFLTSTLLPVSAGGEAYSGLYFPAGAWERPITNLLGPAVSAGIPGIG